MAQVAHIKGPEGSSKNPRDSRSTTTSQNRILSFYLLGYNLVCFLGWFWVLYTTVFQLVSTVFQYEGVHQVAWPALILVQSAAFVEVINSAFGFVRAPVMTTFMQVLSRLFLVWGVNYMFPMVRSHWSFSTMMIAWSIAECVRYSYYATNLLGAVPRALTWARYNFFLILYPTGVGSELIMVYQALPYAKAWEPLYYYFLIVASLAYLPGFPVLFSHMLVQRKKYIKGAEKKQL